MNKKTLFLVITLVAMLILVTSVNATNDNTNTSTTHSISEKTTTTEPVLKEKIENTPTKELKTDKTQTKQITKTNKTIENTKKDSSTIEVYDTTTLTNALTTIQNDQTTDEFIINLNEGNYDFGSNYIMLQATKSYIFNGNNQTITSQMFGSAMNNVKDITLINTNIETKLAFGLASNTGTGKLINSTITSPQLIFNCPTIIIDDNTEFNNVTRVTVMNTLIYTNNSRIINQFIELGVPEDKIITGTSSNDNQVIENLNITEPTNFNGNNITITKSNITAPINTVGNIIFTNCQINAKITNQGNLTLVNCSLSNNNMTATGTKTDGFLVENKGNLRMIDCIVENNTFNTTQIQIDSNVELYGAIVNNGLMSIINSTLNNNKIGYVNIYDGALHACVYGNGAVINNNNKLTIYNSKFSDNYAGGSGGSIANNGNLTISNSEFNNNTSGTSGSAIINQAGNLSVSNTKFINNLVNLTHNDVGLVGGGALAQDGASYGNYFEINNCTFIDNIGEYNGKDLVGVSAAGGALLIGCTPTKIINSTFINEKISIGKVYNTFSSRTNFTNSVFDNTTIIDRCGSNLINNTFKTNSGYQLFIDDTDRTPKYIINNNFTNNYQQVSYYYQGEITSENTISLIHTESYTTKEEIIQLINLHIENNSYHNTSINDQIELKTPQKIYTGEPITITGTYTLLEPENYDPDILEQNQFNIYINGELRQTVDTLEFTITPTNGTMMVTVQPTISQTRKTEAIRATTLTDIIVTPENYNEYIYEGNLIGVNKDTKIIFQGTFNDKEEIIIDTADIVLDGSNATFTNTMFTLEASGITIQNMNINNTQTTYPIKNTKDNNIITGNTITLNNTNGKTAAIYNTASNTQITHNTLTVDGPANTIDYTSGLGVANTQAILLLGGDQNIVAYNSIHVTSSGISGVYGTVEAITNHDQASNTLIRYNNITTDGNGRFNYAINTLANVDGIKINNNNIYVTGERYAAGIQVGNGAENTIIDNNNIKCVCLNTTPVDEEAITYGIVTTNMGSGISNNINITNNNIDLTGSVNYGIEVYQTTNTLLDNNVINIKGSQSMGIGLAHSPNSTIIGNDIKTSGDSTIPLGTVTEEIQPANIGIQIQQDSNNILIEDNTIQTYDVGSEDKCINIECNNVTVKDNNLTSSSKTGDSTITTTQHDTIIDNNNAIEQESTTQTTTETLTTGDSTTLTAQFYDDTYTPVGDGKAIFRVNGKTLRDDQGNVIYVDVINGRAELPDVNITQEWMKPDTTIQAVYVGDNNNEPITTKPTTINVTKPEATITLEAPAPATAGTTITLKATVTDDDAAVNSGRVAFKLNGKTLKDPKTGKALYANVENGIATITYTIPEKTKAKEYTLTAVFTDNKYDRVEAESKLNVVKA